MINSSLQKYYVILFSSVSHVMKAEKILNEKDISLKIIPVPKSISSDCGVCIRMEESLIEKAGSILNEHFESIEIRQL